MKTGNLFDEFIARQLNKGIPPGEAHLSRVTIHRKDGGLLAVFERGQGGWVRTR